MATMTLIEILATAANLLFIILLIKDRVISWPFGIAGSAMSVFLFLDAHLYSEAILYSFYAVFGVWGWIRWHQRQNHNPVLRMQLPQHLVMVASCCTLGLALGYYFDNHSDAARPYIDAFSTAFSFGATYLEVKKVLEAWGYWLILNAISIWLYQDRSLDIYAALIALYTVLSVWGLVRWYREYQLQQHQRQDT